MAENKPTPKKKKSPYTTQALLKHIEKGNEDFLDEAFDNKRIHKITLDNTLKSLMERCAHAGQISPKYPKEITKKYAEKLLMAGKWF